MDGINYVVHNTGMVRDYPELVANLETNSAFAHKPVMFFRELIRHDVVATQYMTIALKAEKIRR